MLNISAIRVIELHSETVEQWHLSDVDNSHDGFYGIVCQQHQFNYLLWHQEDIARSPTASDREMADVKRKIDRLNQQRNDWIEKIDDAITEMVAAAAIAPSADARLNTETPGSAIDRLSILALRIYHLREQRDRTDVDAEQRERVAAKLAVAVLQQQELAQSLQELVDDIGCGRRRHRTYRQMKMYNDPKLNPYIYSSALRRTA